MSSIGKPILATAKQTGITREKDFASCYPIWQIKMMRMTVSRNCVGGSETMELYDGELGIGIWNLKSQTTSESTSGFRNCQILKFFYSSPNAIQLLSDSFPYSKTLILPLRYESEWGSIINFLIPDGAHITILVFATVPPLISLSFPPWTWTFYNIHARERKRKIKNVEQLKPVRRWKRNGRDSMW